MLRTVRITPDKVVCINGALLLLLCDEVTESSIPVFIGAMEANAIIGNLNAVVPPRPMTHDLFQTTLEALGAKVTGLVISELDQEGVTAAG